MRYFERYGLTVEKGKETLAKISVRRHKTGSLNPKAHLRRQVSVEERFRSPL